MTVNEVIQIIAALMLPLGFVGFMWHRIKYKRSIGARAIQFMAVIMLVPVVLILSLQGILDGQTVGTLIGGLTGYLLSGIANYDRPKGESS